MKNWLCPVPAEPAHHLEPGVLKENLSPIYQRLDKMMAHADSDAVGEIKRIRILSMLPRSRSLPCFSQVSTAVLMRQRLSFVYHGRGNSEQSDRQVSPQRLTHYRDNWYLDAYCHWRKALRTFALECMQEVHVLKTSAKDIEESELNEQLGSAYGIFSGKADKQAVLHFTSKRARWVVDESWHPEANRPMVE